jgi:RNase P subunit RPR2
MQFAHSFLFVCPNCKFPIVIGCLSAERNLEGTDAAHFAMTCASCRHSFNLPALSAKKHYVEEWPHQEKESDG